MRVHSQLWAEKSPGFALEILYVSRVFQVLNHGLCSLHDKMSEAGPSVASGKLRWEGRSHPLPCSLVWAFPVPLKGIMGAGCILQCLCRTFPDLAKGKGAWLLGNRWLLLTTPTGQLQMKSFLFRKEFLIPPFNCHRLHI